MSAYDDFMARIKWLQGDERPFTWAERLGLKNTLANIKRRQSIPRLKTIMNMAEAIGCRYEWLMTGEGDPYRDRNGRRKDCSYSGKESVSPGGTAGTNKMLANMHDSLQPRNAELILLAGIAINEADWLPELSRAQKVQLSLRLCTMILSITHGDEEAIQKLLSSPDALQVALKLDAMLHGLPDASNEVSEARESLEPA